LGNAGEFEKDNAESVEESDSGIAALQTISVVMETL